VRFQPDLDEFFGVTHTKQEIHPTEQLLTILVPDVERIARELNGRARRAFLEVKGDNSARESEKTAERHDSLLEPPPPPPKAANSVLRELKYGTRGRVGGLEYRLKFEKLDSSCLYEPSLEGASVTVILNEAHPLVHSLFNANNPRNAQTAEKSRRDLELLILAAARSELILSKQRKAKTWIKQFRQSWSRTLATFLG
jgi:hypothetical protein